MPGGDRTGPSGRGPMTGRAFGYCAGYNYPGYANAGYGRSFRSGRGFGRGFGRGRDIRWREYQRDPYYLESPDYPQIYPRSSKEEKEYLENLVKNLEDEIKMIRSKIQNLSKEKKEE
jgi:hypothetical protein